MNLHQQLLNFLLVNAKGMNLTKMSNEVILPRKGLVLVLSMLAMPLSWTEVLYWAHRMNGTRMATKILRKAE